MAETLDKILSGDGAVAPASEPTPAKETIAETPATDAEPEQHELPDGRKTVPIEALHAERGKVKRYTEQVASFEQTLKEKDAAWERRMSQVLEAVKPKEPSKPAPDFYDDPAAATQHQIAPHLKQVNEVVMANAKLIAGVKFGDDEVEAAEKAFLDAMQSQKLDPADYHKVVGSPNRFAAAVQWHKRQQAQEEIGPDPAAYRAKVEAEILAKHGLTTPAAPAQQQQPAPVMPSNLATARNVAGRSGPAWAGPTSLDSIFATAKR